MILSENYISVDIETSGIVPGVHNILSIGAVPIINGRVMEFDGFYYTIKHKKINWEEKTYEWWIKQPNFVEFMDYIEEYGETDQFVFGEFEEWLSKFEPFSFVGDPICFDFGFLDIYMREYFSRYYQLFPRSRGVDIRTLRMAFLKTSYKKAQRELIPKLEGVRDINHNALTDAINQAFQFVKLCRLLEGKK
jgi:DNA polymerase III epsilon subunit-like protein